MSSPPDKPPMSTSEPEAKTSRRSRGNNSGGDGSAVSSAKDAPAPPRRGRRGAGAKTDALTAAAATAAATPAAEPDAQDTSAAKPAAKRSATSTTSPPKPTTRGTSGSGPPRMVSSTAPPRTAPRPADAPAAVSEVDAEAVLVDDSDVKPARKNRESRTASASVPVATAAPTSGPPSTPTPAATPSPAPAPVISTPVSGSSTVVTGTVGRADRHYRQTVTKVDLWSVTKLSLCFYLSAMFVTIVAFVMLYVIAAAAGIIHSVEKFLGDLLSAKNFHFLSATVLRGGILVGLVIVMLQVVITVIACSFYNIFAELFGGVEITVREDASSE